MNHRVLEHRARAIVALLLACLAALTLAACGSDDDKGGSSGGGGDTADARTLLRETFTGTKDVRSGKFTLAMRADEDGGDAISVRLAGPFESQGDDAYPKFDISADVDAGSDQISAGMVSTSDRLFVKFEDNAYEIPAQYLEMARRQTGTEDRTIPELPDIDPQSWVTDPQIVGDEEIGGTETTHISAGVDVTALMNSIDRVLAEIDRQGLSSATGGQVPSSIPADARRQIESAVRDPRVDIWTGKDDKTIRKFELNTGVEPESGRGGSLSLSFELADLNEAQTIEAPTNVRPIDELLAGLGGLLGASGLGGAAGGGATAPSTDALEDYQRCLIDANGDVRKGQECEALLTR